MDWNKEEHLQKWRLILGKDADPDQEISLDAEEMGMDDALDFLYEEDRKGGLGKSAPKVNRWLGDIRKYFPKPLVQVMQKDAMERLGLDEMLLEPELLESVEPDVNLVGTLLSLNKVMPEKTRSTARKVVEKVVKELEKKLANPLRSAIEGSLNKAVRNRRPKLNEIDWGKTIKANLKHYQPDYKSIIPETLIGYGRKKGNISKEIILLVDQSGSMASSVIYSSVFGAVMASMRSLKTHMVVFDTEVVDLTENLDDPVDLLFGTQLGGGTDINRALAYANNLIVNPSETILVMITDLFEGGNEEQLIQRAAAIKSSGVQIVCLLALDDEGTPFYDKKIASKFAALDITSFACTPDLFPDLMAAVIKKEDISKWVSGNGLVAKG